MLICEIVTTEKAVEALAEEWRQLQSAVGQSLFTDYAWFETCWQNLAKPQGKTLHIVTGRLDGKLVAILPLIVGKKQSFRVLQGAGVDAFYPTEVLAESPEHVSALWDAARRGRLYDFGLIRDVEVTSDSAKVLGSFARQHDIDRAPYLKIEHKTGAEWMDSLPKKARTEYRRHMRRLEEKGMLTKHIHTSGPIPAAILAGMIKTKKDWCVRFGKDGLFDHGGIEKFFEQLLDDAAIRGKLYLSCIQCGNAVIAYNLGFLHKKIFYLYLITYNPDWMQYSPGVANMMDSLMWAIDNGFQEFDFLQGDGRYKLRFANNSREYAEWTFSASTVGRIKEWLFTTLRAMKRKAAAAKAASPQD